MLHTAFLGLRVRGDPRRQKVIVLRAVFGLALGGVFTYLVLKGQNWGELAAHLSGIPWWVMALAAGLFLAGSFAGGLRWRLLLAGQRTSALRLFAVQNAGLGADAVSPVRMASVPVQLTLLVLRDKLPADAVVTTIAVKRCADLVIAAAFICLGCALTPGLRPMLLLLVPLVGWGLFGWLSVILAGVFGLRGLGGRYGLSRKGVAATLRSMAARRAYLGMAAGLSVVSWLLIGGAAWVVAAGVGISIAFLPMVAVGLGALFLAGSVPGLPAGAGTFEFTFIYLMERLGVGSSAALAAAIGFHAAILAPALAIAAVVAFRELFRSPNPAVAASGSTAPERAATLHTEGPSED